MEKLKQKTTAKIHQTESIGVRNSKKPAKNFLMCPHRSEFNTYIRFHLPKHLPEDERSFFRNVTSLKNMIQNKTIVKGSPCVILIVLFFQTAKGTNL